VGKQLLVNLAHHDEQGAILGGEQFHGPIVRASQEEGLVVRLEASGEERRLPADFSCLRPAPPGGCSIESTGEVVAPDYIGTFIIHHPPRIRWVPLRISEQEYVQAMCLAHRSSPRMRRTLLKIALDAAAAGVLGTLLMDRTTGLGKALGAIMCGLAFGALVGLVIYPICCMFHAPLLAARARRGYWQHRSIRNELAMALTTDGIRMATAHGAWLTPWQHIHRWREDAGLVLIYILPKVFHIIPKRLATQGFDIEGLTTCLHHHVGPPN
jgi:hypothetical protein